MEFHFVVYFLDGLEEKKQVSFQRGFFGYSDSQEFFCMQFMELGQGVQGRGVLFAFRLLGVVSGSLRASEVFLFLHFWPCGCFVYYLYAVQPSALFNIFCPHLSKKNKNLSRDRYDLAMPSTRRITKSKSLEKIKNSKNEEILKDNSEPQSRFASSSFKPKLLHLVWLIYF